MAIKQLPPEAIETFSLVLHPKRVYRARLAIPLPLGRVKTETGDVLTTETGDRLTLEG